MSQIIVAVATHKPYKMPDEPIYLPLHVGAELHPDVLPDMQGDNTGDNISALNASYSELTGLYWLWKNCDAQYKGLVHYRRLLGSADKSKQHQKDPYEKLVDGPELLTLLSSKDAVLAKQRNYYIETVYDHYSHTLDGSQLDKMRSILSERCPEYLPAWDGLMKSTRVHVFNMFVMPPTCSMPTARGCFPCLRRLVRGSTRVTWTPSLLAGRGAQVGGCWTHGLSTASRMPSSRWLAQSRWTGSRRAPRSWRQSSWARST